MKVLWVNADSLTRNLFLEEEFCRKMGMIMCGEHIASTAGLAILPKRDSRFNIVIFQAGIDFHRARGLDMTRNKVLLHELQHVVMFNRGIKHVEPNGTEAQEVGIIPYVDIDPTIHLDRIDELDPNFTRIDKEKFYSYAKLEDFDIQWVEKK